VREREREMERDRDGEGDDGVMRCVMLTLICKRSGIDVNAAGSDGRTALHWSVDRTKFAVVKVTHQRAPQRERREKK
jgi:hypothetical protein